MATDAKPLIMGNRSIRAWQQGKTQTRRLARPLPEKDDWKPWQDSQGRWWWYERRPKAGFALFPMRQPYAVDELLWIREGLEIWDDDPMADYAVVTYQADNKFVYAQGLRMRWTWKRNFLPSIFMPRLICRYYARVVSVRPERLIDIGDEDAVAEGTLVGLDLCSLGYRGDAHNLYHDWWDSLHKKPGTRSEADPWVWVYGLEKAGVSDA